MRTVSPRRLPHLVRVATLLGAALVHGACATGVSGPVTVVPWAGDVPSAVRAALEAAPDCGLKMMDGRKDESTGSASFVFLDGWQSPQPESSVVSVRVEAGPQGVSVAIEAHPLAEYGMEPPDIRAGSEGLVCTPCAAARAETPMVRYSRGLAMGNAARTSRCLRDGLEERALPDGKPEGK